MHLIENSEASKCLDCGEWFESKSELNAHKDKTIDVVGQCGKNGPPFWCPFCEQHFADKTFEGYLRHVFICEGSKRERMRHAKLILQGVIADYGDFVTKVEGVLKDERY